MKRLLLKGLGWTIMAGLVIAFLGFMLQSIGIIAAAKTLAMALGIAGAVLLATFLISL